MTNYIYINRSKMTIYLKYSKYKIFRGIYFDLYPYVFRCSSMDICGPYRCTIQRSSWSPMGSCRCVNVCIGRPAPRMWSCLPITTDSVICAKSSSAISRAIYRVPSFHSRTSRRCCSHLCCPCRSPLAKCLKVSFHCFPSDLDSLMISFVSPLCRAECNTCGR